VQARLSAARDSRQRAGKNREKKESGNIVGQRRRERHLARRRFQPLPRRKHAREHADRRDRHGRTDEQRLRRGPTPGRAAGKDGNSSNQNRDRPRKTQGKAAESGRNPAPRGTTKPAHIRVEARQKKEDHQRDGDHAIHRILRTEQRGGVIHQPLGENRQRKAAQQQRTDQQACGDFAQHPRQFPAVKKASAHLGDKDQHAQLQDKAGGGPRPRMRRCIRLPRPRTWCAGRERQNHHRCVTHTPLLCHESVRQDRSRVV